MQLDLSSLKNAVSQLDAGLELLKQAPQQTIVRDGVIQRFEFTYELCWKMLKRYFVMTWANPQAYDEISFQNLIREGSKEGLLKSGWDIWWMYRDARAATSHTYDEQKALQVLAAIPDFLEEARYLLNKLEQRVK